MTDQPRTCRAVLRFEKVKSLGVVQKIEGHLRRTFDTPNADPSRANRWLVEPADASMVRAVEGRLAQLAKPPRADSVLAMDVLLSASPEFFRGPDEAPGTWDEGRMETWATAAQGWLAGEHGKRLVASVLHLDEVTPHIQGLLIPIDDRGVLNAKALFNRFTLRTAQTSYAAALRGLGIERGIAGSKATHVHVSDYYAAVARAHEVPSVTVADRARLLTGGLPASVRDTQAMAEHARILEARVRDQERTIEALAAERDRALAARDAVQATADLVHALPIARVLPLIGAVRDAAERGMWDHPTMGRVQAGRGTFRAGDCGGGAVDLVQAALGADMGKAVRFLASAFPAGQVLATHRRAAAERAGAAAERLLAAPVTLADRVPALATDVPVATAYLTRRGITEPIVRDAMERDQVAATRHAGRTSVRFRLVDEDGRAVGYAVQDAATAPALAGEETVMGEPGTFRADHNEAAAEVGRTTGEDTTRIVIVGPAPVEVMRVASLAPRLGLEHLTPGRHQPVTMLAHLGQDDDVLVQRTVREVTRSGAKLWTCFDADEWGRHIEARIRAALAEAEGKWSTVERLYDVLIAAEVKSWAALGSLLRTQQQHLEKAMRQHDFSVQRSRALRDGRGGGGRGVGIGR